MESELLERKSSNNGSSMHNTLLGMAFITVGCLVFLGFFFAAILSKLLPPYKNQFLFAIQEDRYYCLMVPLTLPILIIAVYFHWLSMKLFKHA